MNPLKFSSTLVHSQRRTAAFVYYRPCWSASRKYATRRESLDLPHSLDTNSSARPASRQSVGPFQLGISQSSFGKAQPVKKWSELSAGGKIKRSAASSTNLTVILLGAGLSAVLVYCLTSELFSKNSPTVLHSRACDRISESPQVAKYLYGPLTFHNNPPSAVRPRHRNHHVTSQIMVDSSGREHMILNFYVQGASELVSESYLDSATRWTQSAAERISDITWDEVVGWSEAKLSQTWQESKRVFRYLIGSPITSSTSDSYGHGPETIQKPAETSFLGMFSSLKGSRATSAAEARTEAESRGFTDGEVHADFIRNDQGYFVIRYILIDLPNSRSRNSVRVFVERAPGVRENEPVMRWNS
ncbi:TIM21-domain-containing protein [Mycena floridula]|nr:TIM21-domain-containing protein [Mycena floridula]